MKSTLHLLNFSLCLALLLGQPNIFAENPTVENTYEDHCFFARWVNILALDFFDEPFFVPINTHPSISNYTSPVPAGCTGCAIDVDQFETAVINAQNTWNNAGSIFQIQLGTASGSKIVDADGVNLIGFEQPEDDFFLADDSRLAVCRSHLSGDVYNCATSVLKPNFNWSTGVDIILNPNEPFDVVGGAQEVTNLDYPFYDFETVVAHEFGHLAGLCHYPAATDDDVMFGTVYNADNSRRDLSQSDIAALHSLYWIETTYPEDQVPCSFFSTSPGDDVGGTNPGDTGSGGGGGGGGGVCRIAQPGTFTEETDRAIARFSYDEVRKNVNLLRRRYVQNYSQLERIFKSDATQYAAVQQAWTDALDMNIGLIEQSFGQKQGTVITRVHLDAICAVIDELIFLFETEEFHKEELFLKELVKLKKGLSTMDGKDLKVALSDYDMMGNLEDEVSYNCGTIANKRSALAINSGFECSTYSAGNAIEITYQITEAADLAFFMYHLNGELVQNKEMGVVAVGKHQTTIWTEGFVQGLYVIVPVLDGLPLKEQTEKVFVK